MTFRKTSLAAAALLAVVLSSTGAHAATTVNISATNPAGSPVSAVPLTTVSLAAGTYQISWLGTAGGGLYDGWSYQNPISTPGFRDAFSLTIGSSSTTYIYDVATQNHFANYNTAAAALTAFQTATSFDILSYNNSTQTASGASVLQTVNGLPTFTLVSATTVTFGVPENAGQYGDNTGGVSIALTAVPNGVPEPASYALALFGLAAAGAARRSAVKS